MATTLRGPVIALDPSTITVDQIKSARFTTTFRGYDASEVKLHLDAVAAAYQQRLDTETELRAIVNSMGPVAAVAPEAPFIAGVRTVDLRTNGVVIVDAERALAPEAETVGPEADLLADARREVEEILAAARNEANALVARANDDAARIILRARAESRGRPSADGNAVVEAALTDSHGDPALAREQARMMIEEAKNVRERILTDLSKRRRVAHVQLEQMRVAREKLVESLREARRLVDDASRDLSTAEVEARIAADAAGRRVTSEPLPSAAELEMELLATRHLVTENDVPVEEAATAETAGSVEAIDVTASTDAVETEAEYVIIEAERIVTDAATETEAHAELAPAATEPDAEHAVTDTEAELALVATEPDAEHAVTDAEHAVTDTDVVVVVDLTAAEAASDLPNEDATRPQPDTPRGKPNVEELFARLRREREEAAQAARVTLGSSVDVEERSATVIDLTSYSANVSGQMTEAADESDTKSSKKRGKKQSAAPTAEAPTADRIINLSDAESSPQSTDSRASAVSVIEQARRSDAELDHETQLAYVLGPLREQMVRSIKRVLQDEQSVVLAALRTSRARTELDRLVGTTEEHPQKFYTVIEPALARAFRAGVDRQGIAHDELGIEIGIAEGPTVHVEAITVSRAIVDVLRVDLRSELERVAAPEADASKLIMSMSNHYRAWNTDRLAELVEPSLRTVYHAGTSATTRS